MRAEPGPGPALSREPGEGRARGWDAGPAGLLSPRGGRRVGNLGRLRTLCALRRSSGVVHNEGELAFLHPFGREEVSPRPSESLSHPDFSKEQNKNLMSLFGLSPRSWCDQFLKTVITHS